jgi:hypothetical protein
VLATGAAGRLAPGRPLSQSSAERRSRGGGRGTAEAASPGRHELLEPGSARIGVDEDDIEKSGSP